MSSDVCKSKKEDKKRWAVKRLTKELMFSDKEPVNGYITEPIDDDFLHWKGYVEGPPDTPYAGGQFNLEITFPVEYPYEPPNVRFTTKMYHPNITNDGDICLNEWNPSVTVHQILLSLHCMLSSPDLTSPIVPEIARLIETDKEKYEAVAKEWTRKYAMKDTTMSVLDCYNLA